MNRREHKKKLDRKRYRTHSQVKHLNVDTRNRQVNVIAGEIPEAHKPDLQKLISLGYNIQTALF